MGFKPPVKPSQLRWVEWQDHSDHVRKAKDTPVGRLETNISIGWLHQESDDVSEEAYCICTTGEIDVLSLSKRDIIRVVPVIKPRKHKAMPSASEGTRSE